ncbi:MAG: chromate efflux transporter [Proteobacteria bacterium]|nr:chromate efflux transporter [Pseudomonadota bacterium]
MSLVLDIFLVFLRLGLTSFGGPVAHLGYFRREFVERRGWLDEHRYASIVALCQVLPGPASSQVGMALGLMRGGAAGALAAFIGFTAPSAAVMIAFALLLSPEIAQAPWVHGLKLAAVAVVAQAIWSMAQSLTPDLGRKLLALAAAVLTLLLPGAVSQIAAIVFGGAIGVVVFDGMTKSSETPVAATLPRSVAVICLVLFAALLFVLPLVAHGGRGLALVDGFYRSGALVFGGGHVVLPLLQRATAGWIDNQTFLAGYGAAQAMPGPLFSFAAFLGSAIAPKGIGGGLLCLAAIYLPSFLLVFGALPFWGRLSAHPRMTAALAGINAAVVGLLLAAFYTPVWTGAIFVPADLAIAAAGFLLLIAARLPPWAVVAFSALAASFIS